MVNSFNNHNTAPSAQTGEDQEGVQACILQIQSDSTAVGTLHLWLLQPLFIIGPYRDSETKPCNRRDYNHLTRMVQESLRKLHCGFTKQENLWSPDNTTSSKRTNHIRCLDNKMRHNLSEHEYRILDKAGENVPHKHIGIEGSSYSPSDLCSTSQQLPYSSAIAYINHKGALILGPCRT